MLNALCSILLSEEIRDGGVIVSCMFKGLQSIGVSATLGDISLLKLMQESRIISRIGQTRNSDVVLRSSSNQGDSSNINFLHSFGNGDVDLRNCVFERIDIAYDEVHFVDVLLCKVFIVLGEIACENPGVNLRKVRIGWETHERDLVTYSWVQRFDTASQDLWGVSDT